MKEKLQIVYDQFVKFEPSHGNNYHAYNLARCHLRDLLHKYGGRDEAEQMHDAILKVRNTLNKNGGN